MKRITGRSDDMLIIRGVNVYPSQVESVLVRTEHLSPFYQLEIFRQGNMDTMQVNIEAEVSLINQGQEAIEQAGKKVQKDIKDYIGVSCQVNIKHPNEIPRSQGKAVRVIDHRKES
jgi:phenylacetate-CoA ligase